MNVGTRVYWKEPCDPVYEPNDELPIYGTVAQKPAIDPNGMVFEDSVAVNWDDGSFEICSLDEIGELS